MTFSHHLHWSLHLLSTGWPNYLQIQFTLGAWKIEGGEKDGKEASKREKACKKWTILL